MRNDIERRCIVRNLISVCRHHPAIDDWRQDLITHHRGQGQPAGFLQKTSQRFRRVIFRQVIDEKCTRPGVLSLPDFHIQINNLSEFP